MIFLFFGTSLALLEAELAPFKDWEDISSEQLRKLKKIKPFGHSEASKKGHILLIFPVLGKMTHM